MTTKILIHFNPYRVEMPAIDRFVGEVNIMLPEQHFKLLDLSMGIDLLNGAHIGGDGRVWALKMDIPEPGMEAGKMLEFLVKAELQIREMHRALQGELDKTFLLGK
jgi:hypothetical protein